MSLPSVNKAAHSGFETKRRRHQKSKAGVSVAPQKRTCVLQKDFLKNFFTFYILVPIIPDYLLALEEEQEARDLLGLFWNNTHVNISHFSDLLFNLTFTDHNYTYSKGNFRGFNRVFHKLDEIGSNTNVGIRGFTT